jgi:hypothetical protein
VERRGRPPMSTQPTSSPWRDKRSPAARLFCRLNTTHGDQQGQSLVLIILAMAVVLGMAALTIDVSSWYQKRHQAQVVADAAALAAANCLADAASTNTTANTCTSTTDTTDATNVATTMAARNGVTIAGSNVIVGATDVTVTVPTQAPTFFAKVAANLAQPAITARSVASFKQGGTSFSCATSGSPSCFSLFAANTTCPLLSTSRTQGLTLTAEDSGGGNADIPNAYTNAYLYNGANSGAADYGVTTPGSSARGANCASTHGNYDAKNTTMDYISQPWLPYPAVWAQPTCDAAHTASSWSTTAGAAHVISTPGTYCVSATSSSCSELSSGTSVPAGEMYIDEAELAGAGYEFVGPCFTLSDASDAISSPAGQPLIYGTSNISSYATTTTLPTCSAAADDGTSGTSVYVSGNGAQVGSPIYDQCGTVEFTKNNDIVGYVEAWNIILDKNNTNATGNGPTTPTGGGEISAPGTDALTN